MSSDSSSDYEVLEKIGKFDALIPALTSETWPPPRLPKDFHSISTSLAVCDADLSPMQAMAPLVSSARSVARQIIPLSVERRSAT